jgi:hypothetical protein
MSPIHCTFPYPEKPDNDNGSHNSHLHVRTAMLSNPLRGQLLRETRNLRDALRRLRRFRHVLPWQAYKPSDLVIVALGDTDLFWIDAVCVGELLRPSAFGTALVFPYRLCLCQTKSSKTERLPTCRSRRPSRTLGAGSVYE